MLASAVANQAAAAAPPLIPTPKRGEKGRLRTLIEELEKVRESRVIVYWTTDMAHMSTAMELSLYDHLTAIGPTRRIDLLLRTNGGQTEAPWRIVSLIREFCGDFNVLIPHRAMSSGTLTAMGANSIVMTALAVLGPIDPSRRHPLLPRRDGAAESEPVSVQDMRHAMQFIREAAGSDKEMPYTPEAMAQIFTALFDKIHPLAIGAIEQSYALSKLVGKQCLSTHMDPDTQGPLIDAIVNRLCDDFKSHEYEISRGEARKIGLNAVDAPDDVEGAMMNLLRFYSARTFLPFSATQPPTTIGQRFQAYIAWLDSAALNTRVEGNYVIADGGESLPRGDQWVTY
jgi:hypothetical protein